MSDTNENGSNGSNGNTTQNNNDQTSNNIIVSSNMNTSNVFINNISSSNIINFTLDETIVKPGFTIHNQQGTNSNNEEITHTTFISTNPANVVNITEDLLSVVNTTYDETSGPTSVLYSQISDYASKINCSSFHGKGTIDDYTELFTAASRIATESKQMQLDVDTDGFNEFGDAADKLSALFTSFILKLENISIIDDTAFLTAVLNALQKIYNLSVVFGRFKDTIFATTTVSLPKSVHDTSELISKAMTEINCAIDHITYFVSPDNIHLPDAVLSSTDLSIINNATVTINNWNILSEQGVTIAMANNPAIQNITLINTSLKTKSGIIKNSTNILKNKLNSFGLV